MNILSHCCPDWDYMLIDGTMPEIECCLCDDTSFYEMFKEIMKPSKFITYVYQDDKEQCLKHEDIEKPIYGKEWNLYHPIEKNWEFLHCRYNSWDGPRFRYLK